MRRRCAPGWVAATRLRRGPNGPLVAPLRGLRRARVARKKAKSWALAAPDPTLRLMHVRLVRQSLRYFGLLTSVMDVNLVKEVLPITGVPPALITLSSAETVCHRHYD